MPDGSHSRKPWRSQRAMDRFSDSAGVPWEGREFSQNKWSDDSGEAPAALAAALSKPVDKALLHTALLDIRLLIPLVAELGESGEGAHGQVVDKSADLAIVAVATPDGQTAIPAFSSVAAMAAWKPEARPVPVEARKVALAAASEGHSRVVLDPAGAAIAIRRPQIEALAKGESWEPPHGALWVREHAQVAASGLNPITSIDLFDGDPDCNLAHAELLIQIGMRPSIRPEELEELLTAFTTSLRTEEFQKRVDSIGYRLVVA